MISLNFKKAFEELDIDDKKNKLSDELIFIGELLKQLKAYHQIEPNIDIKNYDLNSKLSEDEFLSFIYDDVFEIEKQILTILYSIQNNKS